MTKIVQRKKPLTEEEAILGAIALIGLACCVDRNGEFEKEKILMLEAALEPQRNDKSSALPQQTNTLA
jgi:hypothetical protein